MSKKKHVSAKKSNNLKKATVFFSVILVLSLAFLFVEIWDNKHSEFVGQDDFVNVSSYVDENLYKMKENVETILILGLDKFENKESGYNNDKQADFLMLLVVDNALRNCKAIHINRDTMTEMNVLGVAGDKIGTTTKQIALSHTYGNGREVSCRNTANAVSDLLKGIEIDHYVSVTMEAVPVYNDLVGGVDIQILDDFTGIDDSLQKGTVVNLKGEQALKYVRSRQGLDDPTNNSRMKRQKQYIDALYDKTRALIDADESFIQRAFIKVTDYIVSDCSINKLESLVRTISDYEFGGILNIGGRTEMGESFVEFYPDESSVRKVLIDCFYEERV